MKELDCAVEQLGRYLFIPISRDKEWDTMTINQKHKFDEYSQYETMRKIVEENPIWKIEYRENALGFGDVIVTCEGEDFLGVRK